MSRLTLSHLACTVGEDHGLVLFEECLWMTIVKLAFIVFTLVHEGQVPGWILERILYLEVTIKRVVKILHVRDDVHRDFCTILVVAKKLLDLFVQV